MVNERLKVAVGAALATTVVGLAAAGAGAAAELGGAPTTVTPNLTSVLAEHGLRDGELVRLTVAPVAGEAYTAPLMYDGGFGVLELEPHSVRTHDFMVYEAGADGELVPVEPAGITTLRGTLRGTRNASVAGRVVDGGLEAVMVFDDGGRLAIEPVNRHFPAADELMHVVYDPADADTDRWSCAAGEHMRVRPRGEGGEPDPLGGTGLAVAELAIDADYEYYLDYGSTAATTSRIESVINTMNLQYESEVQITHTITAIIVRTSSADPYSSTDAVTLLNQFRNHWNANQGGIQRDVAQLFTGKEINGGTIGIAWLSAICSSYGYGMVQSDFNGNFASATDLSAHELGHNWSADHCSCTSYTMNPYITSANTFSPTFTRNDIAGFRDAIGCLDSGGGGGGGGGGDPVDPIDLTPSSVSVSRGTIVGGSVASLADGDDDRLQVQAESQGPKFRTETTVTLDGGSAAGTLDLLFEISCSASLRADVRVYNATRGKWDRFGRISLNSADAIVTASGLSAADYVSTGGEVRVMFLTNERNEPHVVRIDHVEAIVTP